LKVTVIGLGHVGLTTAACLAHVGHDVVGMDDDTAKAELIERGEVPFFEPDLPSLLRSQLETGRLTVTRDVAVGVHGAEVALICVGTPIRETGEANLSSVERVARTLAPQLTGYTVLAEKSTVPVGTGERVRRTAEWVAPSAEFDVASNPEFLREGRPCRIPFTLRGSWWGPRPTAPTGS
jgi:UDPglucose 6-dehydrogenase